MASTTTSNTVNNNPSPNTSQNLTFNGLASLIRLLPTGTMFTFNFLSPVLSNYGKCHVENKYLMGALLVICGFICVITTFTDSYVGQDGRAQYGIATWKGFWPKNSNMSNVDWSSYKVSFKDFVHAILGGLVFAVVAVLDANTVNCYAPAWESSRKSMLMVLPTVVGVVCSSAFAMFPCSRHGIGYPPKNTTTPTPTPTATATATATATGTNTSTATS